MKIELSKETIDQMLKLNEAYYFGLFKSIVKDENEEMNFRDALAELAKAINSK